MYTEVLAARLKKARKDCKMTQEQVAKEIGISQEVIAQYENGKRIPQLETFAALAQLYCHSTDYFVGLADD